MQRHRTVLAAFAALLSATPLAAQLMPDTPVENFKLFGFDEETGWRVWQLEGSEGQYLGDHQVQVTNMVLSTFEPGDEQHTQLRIESPQAVMDTAERSAKGPGDLSVTGRTFYISGEDWSWKGNEDILTISKNAHVVIRSDLGSLLK